MFCIPIIPLHLHTGTSVHDGSGTLPVQAALTLAMVDSVHKTVAATLAPMRRDDVIRHLKQCAPEVRRNSLHANTHEPDDILIRVHLSSKLFASYRIRVVCPSVFL